ncbi:MAG: ROK family protein [Oscillibacter sp.]|nr:ROK family protein [Oscillibacter sp.]
MYIGIDVGGTNLKAGLVDETGRIVKVERIPLDFQGPEHFAGTLAELSKKVIEEKVRWVGVGLPGAVNGGDVLFTTNIPMENVPLEKLFRQHLDLPLLLGNDADCAAVGEFFGGAGKGTRDFAVVTLGTGVGAGIIVDGKLRGGLASSEAGHMVICRDGEPCNCGRRGCWERYASATGLIQQTKRAMETHPESALHTFAGERGVEGRTAFQAAEAGDAAALAVCRDYVHYLASGLTNLINALRPEAVAIGGGVAAAPERLLLEPLREAVAKESFARHGGRVTKILPAELGNDAGIIGAAMLGRVM